MTHRAIAKELGISRARVEQIERRALDKLLVACRRAGLSLANLLPGARGERP